jgi:DNA-directed RNA polymerase specialized sigma24 family protein
MFGPRIEEVTMPEDPKDDSIRDKLLRGDEDAWAKVFHEIMPRARSAIRRRFGTDQRSIDAEDGVNSALRTIYRRLKEDLLAEDLNCWDDLQGLLIQVAHRKLVDILRKSKAEDARGGLYQSEKERNDANVKDSVVLRPIYEREIDRAMDEFLRLLYDALENETERIVFQGKLDKLKESDIADRVEAKTRERMTAYMVRETWRKIRERFHLRFPGRPDTLGE